MKKVTADIARGRPGAVTGPAPPDEYAWLRRTFEGRTVVLAELIRVEGTGVNVRLHFDNDTIVRIPFSALTWEYH